MLLSLVARRQRRADSISDQMVVISDSKNSTSTTTATLSKENLFASVFPISAARTTSIHKLLPKLMKAVTSEDTKNRSRLVDFGAGVRDDDPMFPFIDTGLWDALLVDGDPQQEGPMAKRFPHSKTVISYITAQTVPRLLADYGFGKNLDLLKIDIDSFDCFVMNKVLTVTRPSVIVMEVNVKFPPHIRFAMMPGFENNSNKQYDFDSEQRGHVYGCSLAYQVHDLMRPNGYEILHLDTNNAIYFDKRHATSSELKQFQPPPLEDIYNTGYWDHPERGTTFAFNNEIGFWQQYFSKQLFRELQGLFLTKTAASHKYHHVYMGDVNSPTSSALLHGCFDEVGKLEYEHVRPEKCTNTAVGKL